MDILIRYQSPFCYKILGGIKNEKQRNDNERIR